jgi:3-oxoacyl-[acyl-carrier-protein] synthase I
MLTSVGLNGPASCAAIRCGLSNFTETRFLDKNGQWITGSSVPLEQPWRGRKKLVHLAGPAIRECLAAMGDIPSEQVPLLLCVAEKERPGRMDGLDDRLFFEVQEELDLRFHEKSSIFHQGRVGGVSAIRHASSLMYKERLPYCIVAGVDTFLTAGTLAAFDKNDRILTETSSDGFIPGEAGAAVLLSQGSNKSESQLSIKGIGFGREEAHIDSGEPLQAEGLVQALKEALSTSGLSMGDLGFRITDANGEQYKFKEGDLAVTRLLREHKGEFDIWHPADCIGEVGAATVFCVLGVAETAARKGYSKGNNVLCHFGNDNEDRAVMILTASTRGGV